MLIARDSSYKVNLLDWYAILLDVGTAEFKLALDLGKGCELRRGSIVAKFLNAFKFTTCLLRAWLEH